MFIESNFTEVFERLDSHCKQLAETLLEGVSADGNVLQYELLDDLFAGPGNANRVFLIEEGAVGMGQSGGPLFFYDAGDILGLEDWGDLPNNRLMSESPVTLRPYDRATLMAALTGSAAKAEALAKYLMADVARRTLISSLIEEGVDKASLGFAHFAPGEIIIQEGTASETVYSIVEGHADVTINGFKVGEILEDEIFGALSLLTHSPRTATVTATKNCLCLVVPRSQFETLIKTHPRICMNLMENMARQIVALNKQVMDRTPS